MSVRRAEFISRRHHGFAEVFKIMEPKIVAEINGKKLYWCYAKDQQLLEELCKGKYFSRDGRKGRACRLCLGMKKGQHWEEPWASIDKEEEKKS